MRCDRMPELDRDKVRKDFAEAVNMTASELKKWLATKESRAVGWKGKDGKGTGESVGHASGRRIVAILGKTKAELTDDDYRPHAQGRRLCSPPSRAGAGEHRHVALALFADELGQRPVEKLGPPNQHRGSRLLRIRTNPDERRGHHMKRGFCDDIDKLTIDNEDFRRVLYTGEHLQLVLMTLQPGEEIGAEVHEDRDQFFRFEEGAGRGRHRRPRKSGDGRLRRDRSRPAPATTCATPERAARFYTLYGPPEHKDKVVQRRRPRPTLAIITRNGTARRPNRRTARCA